MTKKMKSPEKRFKIISKPKRTSPLLKLSRMVNPLLSPKPISTTAIWGINLERRNKLMFRIIKKVMQLGTHQKEFIGGVATTHDDSGNGESYSRRTEPQGELAVQMGDTQSDSDLKAYAKYILSDPVKFNKVATEAFKEADMDSRGTIDESELYNALHEFSEEFGINAPSPDDVSNMFTALDKDNSGKLSLYEFKFLIKMILTYLL